MSVKSYIGILLFLISTFSYVNGQNLTMRNNSFAALDVLNCTKFKELITEAQLTSVFTSYETLTLFVFDDQAYAKLSAYQQSILYDTNDNLDESRNVTEYINSLTVPMAVLTSSFSDSAPYATNSLRNRKLFLNKRSIGTGAIKYFCNGAMVTLPDIQVGKHVVHVLSEPLKISYDDMALAYISRNDTPEDTYLFFTQMIGSLSQDQQRTVKNILDNDQVTFFIPSNEAMSRIPSQKWKELQANTNRMLQVVTLHIIPNQVLYTPMVNQNEKFNTLSNSGTVVFRKIYNKEIEYVSAALTGSKTATGRLINANLTVLNGVVHIVDQVLGYVDNNALEQITNDSDTELFLQLVQKARADLETSMASTNDIYVFVPINDVMSAIVNVYPSYFSNETFMTKILEMTMLGQGQTINLIDFSAGYESYTTRVSRSNGKIIKIYAEGNDIYIEGDYVVARVVRPDVGVTNGYLHYIDAVLGVRTRDIPQTIFCRDWLYSTFVQMQLVGLDKYMKDTALFKNQACGGTEKTTYDDNSNIVSLTAYSTKPCGNAAQRCEFTYFVPNGTAIGDFAGTQNGIKIMNETRRWKWLLRRLITTKEAIYIDQLALGTPKTFYADNGDQIVVQANRSNAQNGLRDAYIMYKGAISKIIRSDIGATNGVIHIISSVLFVPEDLTIAVSDPNDLSTTPRVNTEATSPSTTVKGNNSSSLRKKGPFFYTLLCMIVLFMYV